MRDIAAVRLSTFQLKDRYNANEAHEQAAAIVGHIDRETSLHLTYCEGFGVSREEMEATEEKQACTAYTRYEHQSKPPPPPRRGGGLPLSARDQLTVGSNFDQDTSWISASPRTGLASRLPSHRACSATAPWPRCFMGTPGLSGRGIITGTGSRTTLPTTTYKL